MGEPAQRSDWNVLIVDGDDPLADILCEIADPLELVCNPDDPDDLPKILRHGAAGENNVHGALLDRLLHDVDRRISRDIGSRAFIVAPRQRFDRFGELPLGASAHLGNQASETSQIGIETFGRTFQEGHALQTEAFQTKLESLSL
jgi:hypothetical protein